MKNVAILQARCSSTRLPGKVLKELHGMPMLWHQVRRLKKSTLIDRLIIATSVEKSDDALDDFCKSNGFEIFRGSLDDVLDRFYDCTKDIDCENIVRLTADCPLADYQVIDNVIKSHIETGADYTSNCLVPTFPDGLDVEVIKKSVLKVAWEEAKLLLERAHVTPYIYNNKNKFNLNVFKNGIDLSDMRWTVDEPADFDFVGKIYDALYEVNEYFQMNDVLDYLSKNQNLLKINNKFRRNEAFSKSLEKDKNFKRIKMGHRYNESENFLKRSLSVIPHASQTFSKSIVQYPYGASPYFIEKGKGSRVWDLDGNEYIDFVNALLCVNIGYCNQEVDAAVIEQMKNGVSFTLPHRLETEVAEKIKDLVPCAEMVRFAKNGTDATSAAVRLSRAFTKKEHIAVCGYHGWQDWYIASTSRDEGIPAVMKTLVHKFDYNNLNSLENIFKNNANQIAAVIMEPMNTEFPKDNFLEKVKKIAHENGALLIFDETITGFRFSNGGAQELFNVIPDLATFGKGIANGYPLSAVVGRADVMKKMEDVFISGTFGGETLSLAASKAVLEKLVRDNVVKNISEKGEYLITKLSEKIKSFNLGHIFSVKGHPSWSFLIISDFNDITPYDFKTLFMQTMQKNGILSLGTHNISFSHTIDDINTLLSSYDDFFAIVKNITDLDDLKKNLTCELLTPLFKVR